MAKGIYLFGLFLMAVGLPNSLFLTSLSSFIIMGAVLINWDWDEARRRIIHNRLIWLPVFFFGVHLLGLLWTSDFDYAVNDLRIKLPLLLLPLAVGAMPPLRSKEFTPLMYVFSAALLVAVGLSLYHYSYALNEQVNSMRDIVFFTSHIRLSLEMTLAIAFLVVRFRRVENWLKVVHVLVITILVWYLNFIESVTGLGILMALLILAAARLFFRSGNPLKKGSMILGAGALVVLAGMVISDSYKAYFIPKEGQLANLNDTTAHGSAYWHDTTDLTLENQQYIWIFLVNQEMKRGWNMRSDVPFDSLDARGNTIKSTLIRYLASKGLRKDLEGVKKLTNQDIRNIEEGVPTIRYVQSSGIQRRADRLFFQLKLYEQKGARYAGSLIQRFEYWKTGWLIARENPLLGVGTGDVPDAFDRMYRITDTELEEKYWLRAHNQYLTMWLSLGVPGLLVFLAMIFYPLRYKVIRGDLLVQSFLLIFALSCLTEDTLETQAGVTFFIFFYTILLLARRFIRLSISKPPLPRVGRQ